MTPVVGSQSGSAPQPLAHVHPSMPRSAPFGILGCLSPARPQVPGHASVPT